MMQHCDMTEAGQCNSRDLHKYDGWDPLIGAV